MEKQRTPICQAQKRIAELWSSPSDRPTYSQVFQILDDLLPIEREAFEKAFDSGDYLIDDGCGGNIQKYKNKEDYFDQTFTQS